MPLPYDVLSSLSSRFHVDRIPRHKRFDADWNSRPDLPLTSSWSPKCRIKSIGITERELFTGDISFTLIINPHHPWEFPGSPTVRTACSHHCQGPGWNPWSENWGPTSCATWPNKTSIRTIQLGAFAIPGVLFTPEAPKRLASLSHSPSMKSCS